MYRGTSLSFEPVARPFDVLHERNGGGSQLSSYRLPSCLLSPTAPSMSNVNDVKQKKERDKFGYDKRKKKNVKRKRKWKKDPEATRRKVEKFL